MLLHLFYFMVWIYFILIWFRKFYLKKVLENKQIKKRKNKKNHLPSPWRPEGPSDQPASPRPRRWAAAPFSFHARVAWASPGLQLCAFPLSLVADGWGPHVRRTFLLAS
jgi:hypothetical protein